ncbi:MAG: SusC/RagA family TonB-linked outer membrane protein [Chitinophagaceae bacterium]|nr:SusC/RagA family TonB-linked outer membrane protein [Chitinophagaceae bacterium]
MKLNLLALVIICVGTQLLIANDGKGQTISDVRITLECKEVALRHVFTKIERQSDFRFAYKRDQVEKYRSINLEKDNRTLEETLNLVLRNTNLGYRLVNKSIILFEKEKETSPGGETAIGNEEDPVSVNGVIRGKVRNARGTGVAGATVTLDKTNKIVAADDNGDFTLSNVKAGKYTLRITAIGYVDHTEDIDVTDGTIDILVSLNDSDDQLGEVVVTALGIQRQARTLTYSTQKISGEKLNEVRSSNIANSLTGKVAGMVVTSNAYGPGSSAKILLRGNRSIAGDNGALIVVDGAIIDNSSGYTRYGYNSNTNSSSDGISSINPDDVESINVLKGSAATALYGTTGANGVIIITTKKGKSGKLAVNINSGATYDSPMLSPEVQNEFAQGNGGVFGMNSPQSWGPKIAGQQVTDWTGKQTTLAAQPDNLKGFFRGAASLNNAIGLSGGTDITQTYFSYANVYSEGIVPENNLKRHTINLRITSNIGKRFSTDAKVTYVHHDIEKKPGVGGGSASINIYRIPRTVRLEDVKNYESPDASGAMAPNYWYVSPFYGNPYWTIYNTGADERRDRITGLVSGKLQITNWLDVKAIVSLDLNNTKGSYYAQNNTPGAAGSDNGSFGYELDRIVQRNIDVVVSGRNNITEDLKISYNVGGTVLDTRGDITGISVRKLIVPNRFNLSFAAQADQFNYDALTHVQRQAIFGTAQLSFKDYLYLDGTARQEYFSTLPSPYYSFYPSVGLSAILSDMFDMASVADYAKVRLGYARTGGGGPGYLNEQTYTIYPNGIQRDVVSPFPDLKPELTTAWEMGTEWRFLKNRLNVDVTVYKSNTTNQLLRVPTPPATGFQSQYINAGDIQNSGVELMLNATPVMQPQGLTWDVGVNFAKNKSKVLEILPGIDQVQLDANFNDFLIPVAKVGGAFGDLYAFGWKRNASGDFLVAADGRPQRTDEVIKVGNYNPDFTLGITNSFTYQNFDFSFLVDGRFGGEMISASDAIMAADGTPQYTASHREAGSWLLPAVQEDGSKNATPIDAETFWTTVSGAQPWSEEFVYDATNVRLRELSLGYRFRKLPVSFIKDVKISIVGRNLFFFYRGFAKVDLPGVDKRKAFFDSEVNLFNSNLQGFEYGTLPPTRSIGLNLKLSL